MHQFTLSIVIITRNEAKNISRCIESVTKEILHFNSVEVFLVDSASTDETVEIAKRYPINILRLKSSWFLSAAAGRYLGTFYSRGNWILFLDGDMELANGWLEKALQFTHDTNIAGISGNIRDIYIQNGQVSGTRDYFQDPVGSIIETSEFGGAALYSRSALERVGGYNPFIKSDEEPELCLRLRFSGYKLIRLPDLIASHYCIPSKSFLGQVRRARMNYFIGFGQISRAYWGTQLFWVYQKERGFYWPFLIGICISFFILLISVLVSNIVYILIWSMLLLLGVVVYIIKKRSLGEALQALLFRGLITYGAVRGFFIHPQDPESYPKDVEVVKRAFQLGGQA